MFAVVGTVPRQGAPFLSGEVKLIDEHILVQGSKIKINRGTPALLAAAVQTGDYMGLTAPHTYLAGDIGLGNGSLTVYENFIARIGRSDYRVITFHYLQPDVDWHNRVLFAVDAIPRRPLLIADAGFMYAAKMSGQSSAYDLFTPDVGELAFLADEEAPHPFYTRGFILHDENRVPELISRAYAHQNASRYLLVKGKKDYIAHQEGILATVEIPKEEAMEAIGGTGDTLTGIVSAFMFAGIETEKAAILAAQVNRIAGRLSNPTPATQVIEIIRHIPDALKEVLK